MRWSKNKRWIVPGGAVLLLAVLAVPGLPAQEGSGKDSMEYVIGLDAGVPLAGPDRFAAGFYGFFLEYRSLLSDYSWLFNFDVSRRYYDYQAGQWYGPLNWSEVDSGSAGTGDWIFYSTDLALSLLWNWRAPLLVERVDVFLGLGPVLLIMLKSEAMNNYPEFEAYYEDVRGLVPMTLGLQLRSAAEYSFNQHLAAGGGLEMTFGTLKNAGDDIERQGGFSYLARNASVFIYVAVGF